MGNAGQFTIALRWDSGGVKWLDEATSTWTYFKENACALGHLFIGYTADLCYHGTDLMLGTSLM
jgi:hypothetical protein